MWRPNIKPHKVQLLRTVGFWSFAEVAGCRRRTSTYYDDGITSRRCAGVSEIHRRPVPGRAVTLMGIIETFPAKGKSSIMA
jgi:hypothetical protein